MPSSKFRVGRSETGLGLFATKTIKKSAYIATYRGRRISSDEAEELEELPLEANAADAAEQARVVAVDDDDDYR